MRCHFFFQVIIERTFTEEKKVKEKEKMIVKRSKQKESSRR